MASIGWGIILRDRDLGVLPRPPPKQSDAKGKQEEGAADAGIPALQMMPRSDVAAIQQSVHTPAAAWQPVASATAVAATASSSGTVQPLPSPNNPSGVQPPGAPQYFLPPTPSHTGYYSQSSYGAVQSPTTVQRPPTQLGQPLLPTPTHTPHASQQMDDTLAQKLDVSSHGSGPHKPQKFDFALSAPPQPQPPSSYAVTPTSAAAQSTYAPINPYAVGQPLSPTAAQFAMPGRPLSPVFQSTHPGFAAPMAAVMPLVPFQQPLSAHYQPQPQVQPPLMIMQNPLFAPQSDTELQKFQPSSQHASTAAQPPTVYRTAPASAVYGSYRPPEQSR
jgi:hypothetical protein